MAKYTVNYSCGHGSIQKELFGPHADRERKIEWMESNMVCPECYKSQKADQDAAAEKSAHVALVPGVDIVLQVHVEGQIEANKTALYDLGFRWSEKADGILGYFSMSRPGRCLATAHKCGSAEDATTWLAGVIAKLDTLGYKISSSLGPLDEA